jgi:hypothetical protein
MRRIITIASVCVIACLFSASLASAGEGAGGGKSGVAKQCAAQKKLDKSAFNAVYGKHAVRDCKRGPLAASTGEFKNAAKDCKSQQQADPVAFSLAYGEGNNAFGKCVKATVHEDEVLPT